MSSLTLTVLGSGTSMGVPTLGCHCAVCESTDPMDKRTRPSVLLSYAGRNVVIDTTPDFRFQAMRAKIDRLDAVIFTHAHADHILGLDDIRPYNMRQKITIPIYGAPETLTTLQRQFSYIFDPTPTDNLLPSVKLNLIDGPFELFGLTIVPVPALHGTQPVLGFRFGKAAYLTDFIRVPDESKKLLHGLDDFILDALRYVPHPMHSNVEQSLALVDELKPKRAWFTHICHDLSHATDNPKLPGGVQLAYDGLHFEVAI
jgi:phosphoribosyl 1,2-cyclic phosphate phosphodiesterase